MKPKKKKKHQGKGGLRVGAGRKNVFGKTIMKTVKLTDEFWNKAKKIGDGNQASGIRKALDVFVLNEEVNKI
jgi:hypothetical protein